MDSEITSVLKKLKMHNFEGYVVGGYVRDKLLGIESSDVDIATNALPKDLMDIFNISSSRSEKYGNVKIYTDKYQMDITTYRKELSYNNRRPEEIKYISSLEEDLKRRDFTINTIAMDINGEIKDYYNGIKDLQNKIIKCVGDANLKFEEDPLRILRAIRFACVLDFKLDDSIIDAIKKNIKLVSTLSKTRIKEELSRILVSNNRIKTLDFMNKLGILKELNIKYDELVDVDDLIGMYAQIDVGDNFPFTKEEKRNIELIKSIVKQGKIDNITLFNNGLYISMVAAKVLNLNVEDIVNSYNNLVIKTKKELNITYNDLIKVIDVNEANTIKKIYNILISKVLNQELQNTSDELIKYVINNKEEYL